MKTETRLITGIDIGTANIRVVIAELDEERNEPIFFGYGTAPAAGMRRGVVTNMEKAVLALSKAVEDAEMMSSVHIDTAVAGIAGDHIKSINSHGVIAVSGSDSEITERDIRKVIEAASAVAIPADREILHILPQEYTVDDQTGIKSPLGMNGVRLEVDVHIVTAAVTSARNIQRSLEKCEICTEHLVLQSLAAAHSAVSSDEEDMGAVLIDIGGDITDVAVFFDGSIRHTGVLALGGKNVTNDVTIGLRTTLSLAENLKLAHGAAMVSLVDPDEMMEVTSAGGQGTRNISRNVLASIIEPRMEEIFTLAAREIKKANPPEALTAGVILAGGGTLLPGTAALAEQILDMPARLAVPRPMEGMPPNLTGPEAATVLGLIRYGLKNGPGISGSGKGVRGLFRKIESWFSDNF